MKEGFINSYKILDEANEVMNEGRRAKHDGTLEQAQKRIFETFSNECVFNFQQKK